MAWPKTNNHYKYHNIGNEHSDMQANKLNAKYHLHVQHSADSKTQSNCIKDIKSNKDARVMYLKKIYNI